MEEIKVDEILKDIDNYISFANKSENFSDINEYLHCKELARRMKGLLDLYQKEKEKNNLLIKRFKHLIKSKIISSYDEVKNGKYIKDIDKFDTDYINKNKIKPFVKAIESHVDYIYKDEESYYKDLEKLAHTLEKTLYCEITTKEKDLCITYDPLA